MTTKEFADKMKEIATLGDKETRHMLADDLLSDCLKELGFHEGCEVFNKMQKWYD